uniref:mucin-5AC-like n=1 Tax=Epinephelus lanceolatus TaxID=310571 RepID=UPI0014451D04|nr:mucin-5AC-like [Epinephelus lanceolatus]
MTAAPTTAALTTAAPTTAAPTTAAPTTATPTTATPTTAAPSTAAPTTDAPTTAATTTAAPTTAAPTPVAATTAAPTTAAPTTAAPTTAAPTTLAPTTAAPTTAAPTTATPTSAAPTTAAPTTAVPTTAAPTTAAPTTAAPTTAAPTTATPTTAAPTTATPTTAAPTTVAPTTAAAQPRYSLSVDMAGETFSEDLNDRNSPAFKALAKRVVATCFQIYRHKFPDFVDCIVTKFSALGTSRAEGVQADFDVVFNQNTTDPPPNVVIASTLQEAVSNTNNSFNVSINPSSVTLVAGPVATPTTTAAPTTAAATTAALTTTVPTTAAPTTVAPSTAAPTTVAATTAAPTTVALMTKRVTFRSVQGIFTSDLLNPSSAAYMNRAAMIVNQLTPIFQREFGTGFKSLKVVSFSNGSIFNTLDSVFESTSAPNDTQIASALTSASAVTTFDIETSSITVNGISSSGVSHKISLVTACCLVLLSWLLSSQQ